LMYDAWFGQEQKNLKFFFKKNPYCIDICSNHYIAQNLD
jgi:hypothetical protein